MVLQHPADIQRFNRNRAKAVNEVAAQFVLKIFALAAGTLWVPFVQDSDGQTQQQFCQISPHVPFVYEHGLESPYFYVAMEYLDGENLSDVISRGPVRGRTRRRDGGRVVPVSRGCAPLRS